MHVHIATHAAGIEFSKDLQAHPRQAGHEIADRRPKAYGAVYDYPIFCINAAKPAIDAFIDERSLSDGRHTRGAAQLAEYEAAGLIADREIN